MEAPDKIYIPNCIDTVSKAILTTTAASDDIEYIRKDLLLEWAKPRISGKYFIRDDSFRCGYEQAVKEFIDKINSL